MARYKKLDAVSEITPAGILAADDAPRETDLQRVERKVDELNANVVKMIESIRIFKLNFQQTSMMRK